jgi:hypothetical protein
LALAARDVSGPSDCGPFVAAVGGEEAAPADSERSAVIDAACKANGSDAKSAPLLMSEWLAGCPDADGSCCGSPEGCPCFSAVATPAFAGAWGSESSTAPKAK